MSDAVEARSGDAPKAVRGEFGSVLATVRIALASLADRNFRVYWSINAAFFVGQGLIQIGAQWLMIGLTDSRSAIGALGAIQGGCTILLSPLGGVLSDRVPKRSLLIWIRLGLSALMAIMTALIVTKNVQVWHLFGSVALLGTFLALSQSATQTYVLDIVGKDRLMNAIGLNSLATGIAAGSGYLLGAILLSRIPIEGTPTGTKRVASVVRTTLTDLGAAVRYIKHDRVLLWLFLTTVCIFWGGAVNTLRPVFAASILRVDAGGLGLMGAAHGLGALTGAIVVAGLGSRLRYKGRAIILGQLVWAATQFVYAQSAWLPLTLGAEFVFGVLIPFWQTNVLTVIQMRTPAEMRNRVLSAHFMVVGLGTFNWWITGYFADLLGDRQAMTLMAIAMFSILVPMVFLNRRLMTLGSSTNPIEAA